MQADARRTLGERLLPPEEGEAPLVPLALVCSTELGAKVLHELIDLVRGFWVGVPILLAGAGPSPSLKTLATQLDAAWMDFASGEARSTDFLERAAHDRARQRRAADRMSRRRELTPRQEDVLVATALGAKRSHLPRVLGISASTCDAHVRAVYEACGVEAHAELVYRLLDVARWTRAGSSRPSARRRVKRVDGDDRG